MLLLLVSASPASASPYAGWVEFTFPDYTSLHDCAWLEGNAAQDRATCRKVLQDNLELSRQPGLSTAVRQHLGTFGAQPLFFLHSALQHCDEGQCVEPGDVRVGPPEQVWSAPGVQNLGNRLVYHMPSELHAKKHVLTVSGLKLRWQSEAFSTPFRHTYLTVRLDQAHPGRLLVSPDWKRSLSDAENAAGLLDHARDMLLLWAFLIGLAGIVAALMGLTRRWTWRLVGRAWLIHALSLLLLLALNFLPPWRQAVPLMLLPLLYLASLPLDAWFIRRGLHRAAGWREAMIPATFLRLGLPLVIATGFWFLSLQ